VLRALARLSGGATAPETVHRARTHLRRLQAYSELIGDARQAEVLAGCVSELSRLRALQVLEHYLTKRGHKQSDRRTVQREIVARREKHLRQGVYGRIAQLVRRHATATGGVSQERLARRIGILREKNRRTLLTLAGLSAQAPKRKRLHRLRLAIKTMRYQEEWALGEPYARPHFVDWLKKAQAVLGKHEDLCQFRRWARKLKLKTQPVPAKKLKRARDRAHHMSAELHAYMKQADTVEQSAVPAGSSPDPLDPMRVNPGQLTEN
jgi:CHAD domain-containing protein